MAQTVENLPAMQETQVQFLGWEDPLEKGTATHSSTLAWRIPRTEEPGGLKSMGHKRVRHDGSNLARMRKMSEEETKTKKRNQNSGSIAEMVALGIFLF